MATVPEATEGDEAMKPWRVMRSYGGVDDCLCRFDTEVEAREYARKVEDQSPFLIWVDGPKEQGDD